MEQVAVKFARFCAIEVVYVESEVGGSVYQIRNRNLKYLSKSKLIFSDNASEIASSEQVARYTTGMAEWTEDGGTQKKPHIAKNSDPTARS